MKTVVTYIAKDGKTFDNQFAAKKYECFLTEHTWEFYNENMVMQKIEKDSTHVKFCKRCGTQEVLR